MSALSRMPALAPQPPVALYVHVPFCVSLCPYCDFVVLSGAAARGPRNRLEPWFRALLAELELRADALDLRFGPSGGTARSARPALRSVYVGGGTPSLLPARWVGDLLDRVAARFRIADGAEVTLEANPGPGQLGDLAGFRAAGVGRLSLGAQSMEPAELRRLGRRHRPTDVVAAVRAARSAGIDRVSVDLLYDVPGQTGETWARTLEEVLALGVRHVSAYALTLDDPDLEGLTGTSGDHLPVRDGARRWRQRARPEQDADRAADRYLQADAAFETAGLGWYEVSNWAFPGQESRHNQVYWQGPAYEALGPGAHAFDGALTRRWNAARLEGYLAALTPGEARGARGERGIGLSRLSRLPPGGEERLDPEAARAERTILALRTAGGVPASLTEDPELGPAVRWGRTTGLLTEADTHGLDPRLQLTRRGRLLSNELFVRLLPSPTGEAVATG